MHFSDFKIMPLTSFLNGHRKVVLYGISPLSRYSLLLLWEKHVRPATLAEISWKEIKHTAMVSRRTVSHSSPSFGRPCRTLQTVGWK
jgi:hypothetical protein